jgi:hypothetical protein
MRGRDSSVGWDKREVDRVDGKSEAGGGVE